MSLGSTQPFWPSGTLTLSASSTSANGKLAGRGEAVLVFNASSAVAFVRFGSDLTVGATTADTPVPPGGRMLIHASVFSSTAAVVLGSGTGAVYLTRGEGTVY